MPVGEVHVGQPEELSSGPHQCTGRKRAEGGHLLCFCSLMTELTHPHSQVVDYYKEACRALENPETASLLGRIQKDWKKLVQMKIYYFAAVAHVRQGVTGCELGQVAGAQEQQVMMPPLLSQLHMGKQAEEQQKFGERVSGLWVRGALRTCSRLLRFCLYITLAVVLSATPLSPLSSPCARLSEPCCRLASSHL